MGLSIANVFMGVISPGPVVWRSATVSGSGHRQQAENSNSRDSYLVAGISLPHRLGDLEMEMRLEIRWKCDREANDIH